MRSHPGLLRSAICVALLAALVPAPALGTPAPAPAPARVDAAPVPRVTAGGAASDHVLVRFKDASRSALGRSAEISGLALSDVRAQRRGPAIVRVPKGHGRDELLAELRKDPNVAYAEPDYERHVLAYVAPDDPAYTDATGYTSGQTTELYGKSWWLRGNGVDAPAAWMHGFSDPAELYYPVRASAGSFKVGVIDTGFYMTHPDRGNVVAGRDFFEKYENGIFYEDGDVTPPPGSSVPPEFSDPVWTVAHGTCTAGEVAAATHNGVGVASAGYDGQAIMYKVMGIDVDGVTVPAGESTILSEPMVQAIYRAADDGCRVISISLGGPESSQSEQDAITYAWGKGCIVVAATGNDYSGAGALYPARYEHVVGVGSFSSSYGAKTRSSFSNYGTGLDILAPGEMVWGLTDPAYGTGYAFWDGTSMATPAAAGAIAHLWRYMPMLTNDRIVDLVQRTATPDGTGQPNSYYGWGYMSVASAMASITATYGYLTKSTLVCPPKPPNDFTLAWHAPDGYPADYYEVRVDGSGVATTTGLSMPLSVGDGPHVLSVVTHSAYHYGDPVETTTTVFAGDLAGATPTDDWGPYSPTGLVGSSAPNVSIAARDETCGLVPGSAEYRFTTDGGGTWSSWRAASLVCDYYATTTQTISATVPFGQDSDMLDQVQFRVTNGSGLVGTSTVCTIRVDSTAPAGSFAFAGGASTTTTATVGIVSSVNDAHAVEMRLSPDAGAHWSSWTPYSAEASVTLPLSRGVHTVSAQYRDVVGNTLTVSHDITLDLPITISRLGGTDRYDTAILTSRAHFTSADTVIIATGAKYPDALSASALAGSYGAPLLLTPSTALYPALPAEIARLGATKAIVIGSGSAVATSVATAIDALPGVSVRRVAGVDRYATSKAIALEVISHEMLLGRPMSGEFFLARGDNFPDALALSPLAYSQRRPIVLTKPTSMPTYTRDAIAALQPDPSQGCIIIAGDKPSVGDAVTQELDHEGRTWLRVFGATRYDTAAAIASYGVGRHWASWRSAGVATGASFPDALGGGAATGAAGGVLLLTQRSPISPQCLAALGGNASTLTTIDVFGGTPTIAEDVVTSIRGLF